MNLKQYRCDMADKLGISERAFTKRMYDHRHLWYPEVKRINRRVVVVVDAPHGHWLDALDCHECD